MRAAVLFRPETITTRSKCPSAFPSLVHNMVEKVDADVLPRAWSNLVWSGFGFVVVVVVVAVVVFSHVISPKLQTSVEALGHKGQAHSSPQRNSEKIWYAVLKRYP